MKHFYVCALLLVLIGCDYQAPPIHILPPPVVPVVVPVAPPVVPVVVMDETLVLAKKSGCLACHSVNDHRYGPAWAAVSVRYKGVPNAKQTLINKVKTGGGGNWTSVTKGAMMPPYSPRVSDDNIEKLVEFILNISE